MWYTPPWWFIVRRSSVGAPNRLIFYEFVPCNIRTVLDRSFLNFFLKISKIFASTNFSKIDPKGGPFYTKIEKIKKGIFFCCKSYFFYLNMNSTCSQLSFEVSNMYVAQNFSIFTFFVKFWLKSFIVQNFWNFWKIFKKWHDLDLSNAWNNDVKKN